MWHGCMASSNDSMGVAVMKQYQEVSHDGWPCLSTSVYIYNICVGNFLGKLF